MTELNQKYFDKKFSEQTSELKKFSQEQTEELARIIQTTVAEPMEQHFTQVKDLLEVKSDVEKLKADMAKIKEALRIQ